MKQKDWERRRKGVLNGWKYQFSIRDTTIQEQLGTWTFAITMQNKTYIAHVLVNSFDYYERHLHLRRDERPITLLICYQHTTCVPIHVEVLDFPGSYEPYQLPAVYTPTEKRGTALEKQVLLGQLITSTIDHDEALAGYASSTRYAYLARLRQLLKPSPGRSPAL